MWPRRGCLLALMALFAVGVVGKPSNVRWRRYARRSTDDVGADNRTALQLGDVVQAAPTRRQPYTVRVGLLFPRNMALLTPKIGFATSAGAIPIALRRIQLEQLLPEANWTFKLGYSQCSQKNAAGEAMAFTSALGGVDVIIGPPCSDAAVVVGVLAKYFNVPQISWAATSVDLADSERFPTLVRAIGSSLRVGRALKELMLFFNWRRVALFYTDDGGTRKCYSIAAGLRKTFAANGIVNVLNVGIERAKPTDGEIDRFLRGVADIARIVVTCLEHEDDGRRLLLRAQQLGLSSSDYVYVMPEYVRDQNRTEVWKDLSVGESDGRDVEGKEAFRGALFMEMLMSSAEEQHYFRKRVIEEIRGYPFFYNSTKSDERYGSLYSPFLHDSLYVYALALNKTLSQGGSIRDGVLITNNSKHVQFVGVSGHVVIDDVAGREPNFVIRGFDSSMRLVSFAEGLMYRPDGDTINLLVPERMIWEARGGFVPVDVPLCGFYGEKCMPTGNPNIVSYIVLGCVIAVTIVAVSVTLIVSYIRRNLLTGEMAKMLWKVNYREIVWLNDRSRRSKSLGSLRTISTNASDETSEAIAKGEKSVARLRGFLVWAKQHQASMVLSGDSDHIHMKELRDVAHDNLNVFIGLCVDAPHPISIWKYCPKGSLDDVIHNENVKLDWFFKYSFIKDLASGMEHLQESTNLQAHGRLRSSNCLLDSRWVLKITDFGMHKLRTTLKDPKEVIPRVARAESPPFRPTVSLVDTDADNDITQIINDCWKEDPDLRPTFKQVKALVRQMGRGRTVNLMDHVLRMIEKYTANLEQTVADRTRQLTDEMKKSDLLLYRMLPKSVADKLKAGQAVEPAAFEAATVLVSDVVGFTKLTARSTPMQTVVMLNELYTVLDDVVADFDVYKMETAGDEMLLVSGLPQPNGNDHAAQLADVALQFVAQAKVFYIPHLPDDKLELRVGIHTGACVAGVVGASMPRYCVFGDTIAVATQMEKTSKPSCIQVTEETKRYLTDLIGGFIVKPRAEMMIKGRGVFFTYWLLGKSTKTIFDNTSDSTSGKTTESGPARPASESSASKSAGSGPFMNKSESVEQSEGGGSLAQSATALNQPTAEKKKKHRAEKHKKKVERIAKSPPSQSPTVVMEDLEPQH